MDVIMCEYSVIINFDSLLSICPFAIHWFPRCCFLVPLLFTAFLLLFSRMLFPYPFTITVFLDVISLNPLQSLFSWMLFPWWSFLQVPLPAIVSVPSLLLLTKWQFSFSMPSLPSQQKTNTRSQIAIASIPRIFLRNLQPSLCYKGQLKL